MKKVFSLLLAILMVVSILFTIDLSAYAEITTGTCGENATWSFDSDTGILTISGTGAMTNYTQESKAPWYSSYRTKIKNIVINDGVTSIGDYAFGRHTWLTSVTIPDSVTCIGDYSFSYCSHLTNIEIPNSVTSIGDSAFVECSGLSSATIGNSVTTIGDSAFYYCMGLTNITIPDSVTSIGESAFGSCTKLTSIEIPNSVTSVGNNAFENCSGLTSAAIGNGVTSIGDYAFQNCTGLTSIIIDKNITSIGEWALYGCTALTDVYYTGSEDDWTGISIATGNTGLTSATIHYDHIHNYNSNIITKPTCIKEGYTTYICSECGSSYVDDYIDATGIHSYSWNIVSGKAVKKCSNCNDVSKTLPFTDIASESYSSYFDYLTYTSVDNSFITGTNTEKTLFSPNVAITRAMFVTILYRMAGSPYDTSNPHTSNPFSDITQSRTAYTQYICNDCGAVFDNAGTAEDHMYDVHEDTLGGYSGHREYKYSYPYYYNAACWALDNGITTQTKFNPFGNVTREQTASFLYRYAKEVKGIDTDSQMNNISSYPDYSTVSSWAVDAMSWANGTGMITGTKQGYLNPKGTTLRIHATKILYGFGVACNLGNGLD